MPRATKDLPHWCQFCGHQIKKGHHYVYDEAKKYRPKGHAYFHWECKYGELKK